MKLPKYIILFLHALFFLTTTHLFAQAPVITSFSPLTGPVGTSLTITGANFSSTASSNTVYFGSAKATITSASNTQLVVTVPAGTTYEPISVTTNNLTAYSRLIFNTTFAPDPTGSIPLPGLLQYDTNVEPQDIVVSDLDGDSKPDLLCANQGFKTISIFKNTSSNSTQISFADQLELQSEAAPRGMITGDVNGDSKPEIIYINPASGTISLFKNTSSPGAISFDPRHDVYMGGSGVLDIAIGDMNNDGKLDLVTANGSDNSVYVLRNTSSGSTISFSVTNVPAGIHPTALAIADIDGDGKSDIAVGNYSTAGAGSISIFRNISTSGVISLEPKVDYSASLYISDLTVADLNGDSKPDVVTGTQIYASSTVSIFKNASISGAIDFQPKSDLPAKNTPHNVSIADMNGDGKPDLCVANGNDGTVSIFENTSSGGTISMAASLEYSIELPRAVTTGDLNLDGKPEMIAASYYRYLKIFSSVQNLSKVSSFSPAFGLQGQSINITGTNLSGATGVSFAGAPASSFTVNSSTSITAILGAGVKGTKGSVVITLPHGTATQYGFSYRGAIPSITSISPASGATGSLVTINGNNFNSTATNNIVNFGAVRATVVGGTTTSLNVLVPAGANYQPVTISSENLTGYSPKPFNITYSAARGFDSGYFSTAATLVPGLNPNNLFIGDLNADGNADLIVANGGSTSPRGNTISVFSNTNSSALTFGPKITLSVGNNPYGVYVADLDNDSRPDILVANQYDNSFSILRNTSTGTTISFAAKVDFSDFYPTAPRAITVADIDKDGRLDLLIANSAANTLSIIRNTSTDAGLSFAPKIHWHTGTTPYSVAVGDLNSDDKPDIAVANYGSNTVTVILNGSTPGYMGFNTLLTLPTAGNPTTVVATDIDGDGKNDLAVSNSLGTSAPLSVFRNTTPDMNFSFATRQDFGTGGNAFNLSAADLDGDGKVDIAVPNSSTNSVVVYKNNSTTGSISLASGTSYTVGSQPFGVFTGDLNNDGKQDIAVSNTDDHTISILTNEAVIAPSISAFTPVSAGSASSVTITGTNLSGATAVSFGGTAATSFTVNSPTKITAIVGNGATGSVSVTTPGGTMNLAGFTFVPAPTITSFSPVSSGSTLSVTITGTNLSGATAVSFGGTAATSFTVNSATSITAVIGSGTSGNVSVTTPGGTTSLAGFTFVPLPTITSFTPVSAKAGTTVTITGTNLSGATAINFGGTTATSFVVNSATTIIAVVGSGTSGTVSVTTPGGTASLTGFTFVPAPTIASFSPISSGSTLSVTITGTNLSGATAVSFGGTPATSFIVNSATSITATVGSGASGSVSVTTPGGTASLTGFTFVPAPTITSFSPVSSGSTLSVTITGTNLSGATAISFGGTPATSFVVNSATSITAIVGSGASGSVSATTPGGTASLAGFTFVASPTITSFTPVSAKAGTTVTITGTNLSGATAVSFGGTPATSFVVNSATSITAMIDNGASGTVSVITPGGTVSLAGFTFVPAPTITSFTPLSGNTGTSITITGTNFGGATQVTIGNTVAAFLVNSTTSITATVGSGSSGDVAVTTAGGTARKSGFVYLPSIVPNSPTTFPTGGTVTLKVPTDFESGYTYQWSKDGVDIPGGTGPSYNATQGGSYTVTLIAGSTTVISTPITVKTIFVLPATNYNISSTDETCRTSNDGSISITAGKALNYNALVTGPNYNHSAAFVNNSLALTNLVAGKYTACITVTGQPEYKQCFDIVVTEPKDLSVYTMVDNTNNKVSLALSGGSSYTIELNGVIYRTDQTEMSLPLSSGDNILKVSTDKSCQGKIQRLISSGSQTLVYPNPFERFLNVSLGDNVQPATVEIRALDGRLVFTNKFTDHHGNLQLDLSSLNSGVFTMKLSVGNSELTYKIVKR